MSPKDSWLVLGHIIQLGHAGPCIEPAAMIGNGRVEEITIELGKVLEAGHGELGLHVTILAPLNQ